MGHKGPVEDLHATEPKWYEPIYYSILFYSILFYSILFYSTTLAFFPLFYLSQHLVPHPNPKASTPPLSPVNRFLKGNSEDKKHSGNRYEDRRIV